ncbi:MAG: protein translocase subunit SecD [Thermodesulfobacteriota bacterium]|nr:protein translocase subunit SecD [Thermodesulfobacteriota bacterium]
MPKKLRGRFFLILGVLIISVFYIIPNFIDDLPGWWKSIFPSEKIHLGLDLQGGMHLILEVDTEKAVESIAERITGDLEEVLDDKNIPFVSISRVKGDNILAEVEKKYEDEFKEILKENFSFEFSTPKEEGNILAFSLSLKPEEVEYIKKSAVDQALETIRNRIDQFGVTEPTVARHGQERILIQLPGIKDPERAISLLGKTALLEFKLVDDRGNLPEALKGSIPPEDEILYQKVVDPETGKVNFRPFLIKKRTLMTGEALKNARVSIQSDFNEPYVSLEFNSRGAKVFDRITSNNVGKHLAIILDNTVYSAPEIRERISGGRAQITGRFTTEEAHDLAIILRSGSLPAPVKILENRTVGPSLGHDSINAGFLSMVIGGILVIIFMVVYYKLSGIVSDFALILNLFLILAALSAFRATLTLPGIAGIILTIGMAVDANVLVFERTREELRTGKTPKAAIDSGFSKALKTILDANITTIIAAIVLFQFGTGPIKGFAVTLIIGIIASVFTAVIVSRFIYDFVLFKKGIKKLSI